MTNSITDDLIEFLRGLVDDNGFDIKVAEDEVSGRIVVTILKLTDEDLFETKRKHAHKIERLRRSIEKELNILLCLIEKQRYESRQEREELAREILKRKKRLETDLEEFDFWMRRR